MPLPTTNIPTLLLASLPGQWRLTRSLSSTHPHEPSGRVTGSAVFTPRAPTAPGYAGECVYAEEGEMDVHGAGAKLRFRRGYVWRFGGGGGGVGVWFIKPEAGGGGGDVDYLFHELEFWGLDADAEGDAGVPWSFRARGHHLCAEDVYETEYLFRVRGEGSVGEEGGTEEVWGGDEEVRCAGRWALESWEVRHTVTGPKKDQRLWSVYTRDGGA